VENPYGLGGNILYWQSSSFTEQLVGADQFGYVEDIASSPFQITVECQAGYAQVAND